MIAKQLIELQDSAKKSEIEMLQAIQFGTNLMHLHVSNLSDFKLLKYGAFVAHDKVFDCVDTINDLIKSYSFEA